MNKIEVLQACDVPALIKVLRGELLSNIDNIPAELKDMKGWLCYKITEIHETQKGPKFNKIPVYPSSGHNRSGAQGSQSDIKNLGTFDDAITALKANSHLAGIGFAPLSDFGVVCLDVDHCVTDGVIREDVVDLVEQTYAEVSPSGSGVRALWLGESATLKNNAVGYELFHGTGFVTITGSQVSNIYSILEGPLPHLTSDTRTILEALASPVGGLPRILAAREVDDDFDSLAPPNAETLSDLKDALLSIPADDYSLWIRMGHALRTINDDGFELWMEWSATSDKFEYDEAAKKWESFRPSSTGYKVVFTEAATRGWVNTRSKAALSDKAANKVRGPLKCLRIHELLAAEPLTWLVKGVIPKSGLGVLYGESGSGKTFIALDLALSLARGEMWHHKKVSQAGVLYVAAEGGAGLSKRLAAYLNYHDLEEIDTPFVVVPEPVNLLKEGDAQLETTCIAVSKDLTHRVGLIVIDTLNRSMPGGDENSSEAMGYVVDKASKLSVATGAFVLIVHHSGKDKSRGARGHSSLRAAVDIELEVIKDGDIRKLTVTKSRDGEDGTAFANVLKVVNLGHDEDLDPITSCVAIPGNIADAKSNQPKAQGKWQEAIMNTFKIFLDEPLSEMGREELITAVRGKDIEPMEIGKRDRRDESIKTALDALAEKGLIAIDAENVRLTSEGTKYINGT